MGKLIVIGDSGHAKVIKDIAYENGFEIVAVLDAKYELKTEHEGIIKASTDDLFKIKEESNALMIIAIGNNTVREEIASSWPNDAFATLISKHAVISPSAEIGKGTVIMAGAVVNAEARIGMQAIINTGAVIEHDASVGDFAHVSPNASLTGGAKIGKSVHIGANAVLNPLVEVGDGSIIGSGAAVINDIPPLVTAVGVPAKVIGGRK